MIMIRDEQYEKLVADGHIKPEDLEAEKTKNAAFTDEIFAAAHEVVAQFSTGMRRTMATYTGNCNLFEQGLEQFENDHEDREPDEPTVIRFPFEGYHRTVFLTPEALDYVWFPTHLVEQGREKVAEDQLDEMDADEGPTESGVARLPKQRRKKTRDLGHFLPTNPVGMFDALDAQNAAKEKDQPT